MPCAVLAHAGEEQRYVALCRLSLVVASCRFESCYGFMPS